MSYRVLTLTALSCFAMGASNLVGQVLPQSLVDSRVRLQLARQDRAIEGAAPRQLLRGTLVSVTHDSVTIKLHPEASPISVASTGIYQADVSRGVSRSRTAVKHALGGAAFMASLGASGDHEFGGGPIENILIWAGGGLVLGAVLGAILPEEQWTRVFRR